jgi:hypothetical protein
MTAAVAQLEKPKSATSPLPAEVDERAEAFHDLELEIEKASIHVASLRKEIIAKQEALIELVRTCGGPHAQKSKIMHGIVWEMVATFSQYTTQDAAMVERFREALVASGLTRLMKKIFTADTRWTMQASASEIVKNEKLSPRLMALLLQCSVTQDKKPSLDVRPKKKPAA